MASMNVLMVERMLSMTQLPRDHHEAIPVSSETIQTIRQILHRSNPSSLYYGGLLVILALSPYANTRKTQPL
jgi:hypothetical protein